MRKHFIKKPILCSSNDAIQRGVSISTPEEMRKAIMDNDFITLAVEWANDSDEAWGYDTPEAFAAFAEDIFDSKLDKWLKRAGYTVNGYAVDLVPEDVYEQLREEASQGDF